MSIHLLLILGALVSFILAACNVSSSVNLAALGLALLTITLLI